MIAETRERLGEWHRSRSMFPRLLSPALALVLLGVAALLPAPTAAQIRVNVNEVVLTVSVRDDEERFVPGLEARDFQVYEDEKEQEITDFRADPAALSVALLIDTGVDQRSLDAIVAAIPSMVESFGDFDEVAVFRFDNEVFRMTDFAEPGAPLDREYLRQTLDRLADFKAAPDRVEGPELRPGVPAVGGGISNIPTARVPDDRGRRVLDDAVLEAVSTLRQRSDERRRTIIVVSGGISERSEADVDDVRLALLDANIQVYAINLNGGLLPRLLNPLDSYAALGSYAEWTGGRVFSANGDDLHASFSEVAVQARNQYMLTYVSSNPVPRDRIPWREFRVETSGGHRVSHRLGYYQTP
jgi:VWFA-related protein